MWKRLRDELRPDRPLGGGMFGLIGLAAFAVKFNWDRFVARHFFHHSWDLTDYWIGYNAFYLWDLRQEDFVFFATMLTCSIPFMIFGVLITRRRLNTLQFPAWSLVWFFIPFANLVFFFMLTLRTRTEAVRPFPYHRNRSAGLGRFIPSSAFGSSIAAVGVTALISTALIGFDVMVLRHYGWILFFFLPFVQGMGAAWLYGYHSPRTLIDSELVALYSSLITAGLLMLLAMEGIICIVMVSPIWLALAFLGGGAGWELQKDRWRYFSSSPLILFFALSVPLLMGAEYAVKPKAPLLKVQSSIDIQASPETVWNHVIAFAELPAPKEWIFRTGLAYPIRAQIDGSGKGAMRHCVFSTGEFLEPIEVWNKPKLLRFSVVSTPSPMKEMSLYSHVEPPHLRGYMVSKQGQFLLTALPNGGTNVEGTTWYEHNLWPARYWQFWSDQIIHQIHLRVLKHIKTLAETDAAKEHLHG